MADEVQFKFEFVDKTGSTPASSKPGPSAGGGSSSGVGESFQETAGDAPEKAQQRNERATGAGRNAPASVPTSGASSLAGSGSRGDGGGVSEAATSLAAVGGSARDFARAAASGDVAGAIQSGLMGMNAARGLASVARSMPGVGAASGLSMAGDTVASAATTASRAVAGRAAFGLGASAAPGSGAAGAAGGAGALAGPLALLALGAAIPPMVIAGSIRAGNQYSDSMRDQITQFSPEAAQAAAMAEVRQIMADIRTSEKLGAATARRIEQQSEISEDMQAIQDTLAKPFLEVGNELLSILATLVDLGRQGVEFAEPLIDGVVKLFTFYPALQAIAREMEKLREDQDEQFDLLRWFEKQPHIHPPEWPTPADGEMQVDKKTVNFGKVPGLMI